MVVRFKGKGDWKGEVKALFGALDIKRTSELPLDASFTKRG